MVLRALLIRHGHKLKLFCGSARRPGFAQGNYHVVAVDKNNRASIRTVQPGDRSESFWIIAKGLHPGERVVVEGMQKTHEGAIVNPKPYIMETSQAPAAGINTPTP